MIDAGYDVWMGNNRGNNNSMRHVSLNTSDPKFWDFDFEQMGVLDQPAQMNFITKHLGIDKIDAYVGHSEGTTQFFIGQTMLPDYFKNHVNLFIALAPVARMDHGTNAVLQFIS